MTSPASTSSTPDTERRILDAARSAMADEGLAHLTLEEVARIAGVSRQTVYRYFGSRDVLISAVVLREEQTIMASITAAGEAEADGRAAIEAALTTALEAVRAHPLLERLLATEPQALLPYLTTSIAPVLPAARPVLEQLLAERFPEVPAARAALAADATVRLVVSYAVNPPEDDPRALAAALTELLLDGLTRG